MIYRLKMVGDDDSPVGLESLDLGTDISEIDSWSNKRLSDWIAKHGKGVSKTG